MPDKNIGVKIKKVIVHSNEKKNNLISKLCSPIHPPILHINSPKKKEIGQRKWAKVMGIAKGTNNN